MTHKKTMSELLFGVNDRILEQAKCVAAFDVSGVSDADEILKMSRSDYAVRLGRLALADLDGKIVQNSDESHVYFDTPQEHLYKKQLPGPLPDQILSKIGGHHGVIRIDSDGLITPFTVVGVQYTVIQNKEIVNDALAIAEQSDKIAEVMYAGNERGGRVFFAGLGFVPLEIIFENFSEKFDRHLVIYTGHDGSLAYRTGWRFDDADAPGVIDWSTDRKKHYSHVKDRVAAAQDNIQKMKELSDNLVNEVRALAEVNLVPDKPSTEALINECAELIANCSTRSHMLIKDNKAKLRDLYMSAEYSGRRGYTGWALYRACATLDEHLRESGEGSPSLRLMTNESYGNSRRLVRQRILEAKGESK